MFYFLRYKTLNRRRALPHSGDFFFPPLFLFFSTNRFCLLVNFFFSSFSPVKIMSIYLKTGKSKTKKREKSTMVCMSNYKELQ